MISIFEGMLNSNIGDMENTKMSAKSNAESSECIDSVACKLLPLGLCNVDRIKSLCPKTCNNC